MKHISHLLTILLMAFAASSASAQNASAADAALKTYSVQADYGDVKQDVEDGILNAGLKVDYRGNIGKMLTRTGKDVGSTKKIYRQAEFMQFCSARLSRKAMEADAANMGICPYIIFVYETEAKPGTIHVGYKRPVGAKGEHSQKALGKIEEMLNAIVKEAADQ